MKKVIIKIRGTQGSSRDSETIEFTTEGVMRKDGNDYILSYSEGEIIGGAHIKTRLTAKGNSVILERTGDLSSKLIIEKGIRNSCFYSVPQGELTLGIYGTKIDNRLTDKGGKLEMTYTVDTNLQPLSENSVDITVSEVE